LDAIVLKEHDLQLVFKTRGLQCDAAHLTHLLYINTHTHTHTPAHSYSSSHLCMLFLSTEQK